jgi:formamidopyrimidine-DNA glycosylase
MPELPEVETTLRGIAPYLLNKTLNVVVRERKLRWLIPQELENRVSGKCVLELKRRGKYIIIYLPDGAMIIHLGMSGSLRVLLDPKLPGKHDHFDLINCEGHIIRYHDPRKFGSLVYTDTDPLNHPRLRELGVEPLTSDFDAAYLYQRAQRKSIPIKTFLMDGKITVGVGNIYASETLHLAGINPLRKCSRISLKRYGLLVDQVRSVLTTAIQKGGTTLQDFVGADGSPGYFSQNLSVYGREGEGCFRCEGVIKRVVISQRSTYYCSSCQK